MKVLSERWISYIMSEPLVMLGFSSSLLVDRIFAFQLFEYARGQP